MYFKQLRKTIKEHSTWNYKNKVTKMEEFQIPPSTIIINKDTDNQEIYSHVDGINLFKRGYLLIRSGENRDIDSTSVDFRYIETLEIIPETDN